MVAGKGSGQTSQRLARIVQGVDRKLHVNIIDIKLIFIYLCFGKYSH